MCFSAKLAWKMHRILYKPGVIFTGKVIFSWSLVKKLLSAPNTRITHLFFSLFNWSSMSVFLYKIKFTSFYRNLHYWQRDCKPISSPSSISNSNCSNYWSYVFLFLCRHFCARCYENIVENFIQWHISTDIPIRYFYRRNL